MHIQKNITGDKAILTLSGRFQFDSHREFRAAYDDVVGEAAVRVVVLNMAGVDYLVSSALGMLLLLKEKLAVVNKTVEITGTQGTVKQVLEVANFGRLFSIS